MTINRWSLIDPPETVLESRIGLIDCKNSSQRQVYLLCKQARNVIDNLDDKLINWIDFWSETRSFFTSEERNVRVRSTISRTTERKAKRRRAKPETFPESGKVRAMKNSIMVDDSDDKDEWKTRARAKTCPVAERSFRLNKLGLNFPERLVRNALKRKSFTSRMESRNV